MWPIDEKFDIIVACYWRNVSGAPIPLFDVVPRQQVVDLALFVAIDDGCERIGQIGVRIDTVQFAGLDQGSDDAPVCGSGVVASEERVFAVQSYGTDRAFHGIAVHLDAAVSQKQAETFPVFCDVFERFAQRGLG